LRALPAVQGTSYACVPETFVGATDLSEANCAGTWCAVAFEQERGREDSRRHGPWPSPSLVTKPPQPGGTLGARAPRGVQVLLDVTRSMHEYM
jgi:hypothetical protein